MAEIFRVELPCNEPLSREAYFAKRAIRGLRPCKRLGFGTAGLAGVWGEVNFGESIEALLAAWREDFLLVDSAPVYANGESEKLLGDALRRWKGEPPVVITKLEGYPDYTPPKYAKDWSASLELQFRTSVERFGRPIDGEAMHDAQIAPREFQDVCVKYLETLRQRREIGAIGMGGSGPDIQSEWLATGKFDYIITFKRIAAVTLQGMTDVVPLARKHGTAVIVASPVMMGLLGSKYEAFIAKPPSHLAPVFVERAKKVKALTDAAGISLSHLALRFVLSNPAVDFVLTGACTPAEWEDSRAAYEAGPLARDVYERVWKAAQGGEEAMSGG